MPTPICRRGSIWRFGFLGGSWATHLTTHNENFPIQGARRMVFGCYITPKNFITKKSHKMALIYLELKNWKQFSYNLLSLTLPDAPLNSLISFSVPAAQGCGSYCDSIHRMFLVSESLQPPTHLMFSGTKDWCVVLTLSMVKSHPINQWSLFSEDSV